MSKYKILSALFIVLCIIVSGCSKNNVSENNDKNNTTDTLPNTQNEVTVENNSITEEEYKDILIKNHEKYIKPLDLGEYDNLKEALLSKEIADNEEFVTIFKTNINDNRTNIKSFKQSMENIEIEDSNIKEINDRLVNECKLYIEELDKKENYLEILDNDTLQKSNVEFAAYLDEIIENEDIDRSELENIITEIQMSLDIQLKQEDKIE